MSKKNRERRTDEPRPAGSSTGSSQAPGWLPTVLSIVAIVFCAFLWLDAKRAADGLKQVEEKVTVLTTQLATAQAKQPAQRPSGPDPAKVYPVNLEGAPVKGKTSAPITIAEFSDFQCPFCSRVGPTIKQIEDVYGDRVKVVWKNLPLSFHQNAMPAALAAMAAHEQGKYWEYHDLLFANQKNLTRDDFIKYAKELKLDVPKFTAALDSAKHKSRIEADAAEAAKLGVTGTPAFFINGRFLNGA
jgi:protein-disulfide isomerase